MRCQRILGEGLRGTASAHTGPILKMTAAEFRAKPSATLLRSSLGVMGEFALKAEATNEIAAANSRATHHRGNSTGVPGLDHWFNIGRKVRKK